MALTKIVTTITTDKGSYSQYDRVIEVTDGVEYIADAVDEAIKEETLVRLHRGSDGAMIAIDPWSIKLVEPAEASFDGQYGADFFKTGEIRFP